MLLQSLPASYENFRCAIESRDILPDLEILKIKVLEEYRSLARQVAQPFSRRINVGSQKQKPNYKCGFCKKKRHKEANCFKKKQCQEEAKSETSGLCFFTSAPTNDKWYLNNWLSALSDWTEIREDLTPKLFPYQTKSVALSSNEAEYVSLSDAAKEAIFLSSLLGELGFADLSRTIIYNDNQSAGKLATNLYKPTEEMIADILSKALPKPKVDFCTKGLEISRQE
ncbi:hypothetical protein TKK_0017640 [Trichogramma kaykai]